MCTDDETSRLSSLPVVLHIGQSRCIAPSDSMHLRDWLSGSNGTGRLQRLRRLKSEDFGPWSVDPTEIKLFTAQLYQQVIKFPVISPEMSSSVATATATVRSVSETARTSQRSLDRVSVKSDHDDFFWSYTEEPHRMRRQAIIKAHPEVIFFQNASTEFYSDIFPRSPSYAAQSH